MGRFWGGAIRALKNVLMGKKSYRCTKSLYKSTYKGDAFTQGEVYVVMWEEDELVFFKDNKGHAFNFSWRMQFPYYYLYEYLEEMTKNQDK